VQVDQRLKRLFSLPGYEFTEDMTYPDRIPILAGYLICRNIAQTDGLSLSNSMINTSVPLPLCYAYFSLYLYFFTSSVFPCETILEFREEFNQIQYLSSFITVFEKYHYILHFVHEFRIPLAYEQLRCFLSLENEKPHFQIILEKY
jgi:hypothetical protein